MKKTLLITATLTVLASLSSAATLAINGVYGFNAVGNGGGNLPATALVLVLVDTGSDGFLDSAITPSPISNLASLAIGASLGNDLIVGRFGATNSGTATLDTLLTGNVSFDVDSGLTSGADAGMRFGIVWFDGATTASTAAADGMFYQFGSNSDWILPAAPATRTMGTNFSQLGSAGGLSAGQTTRPVGVPEPSRIAFLGLSILGVMFKRNRR